MKEKELKNKNLSDTQENTNTQLMDIATTIQEN